MEILKRLMLEHLPPVREAHAPNEKALATLRDIAKLKEGMPETDGSQTDQMLRVGRAGAWVPSIQAGDESKPFYETATPEDWSRVWREWAASHGSQSPGLSDEAISRDSIYEGRG